MTTITLEFWGSQGRIGEITRGPLAGSILFAYPDSLVEWWTFVIDPSPTPGQPGDLYVQGNDEALRLLDNEWSVLWMSVDEEEAKIESQRFGWRPLRGPVAWLRSSPHPERP